MSPADNPSTCTTCVWATRNGSSAMMIPPSAAAAVPTSRCTSATIPTRSSEFATIMAARARIRKSMNPGSRVTG